MNKKNNHPLVSIIIVHFNGFSVLKNCLHSLSSLSYKNFEVIVVDNHSSDDSVTEIKKIKLNFSLKLLELKRNLGFAGGNNAALKVTNGKYLLLLNNDTTVKSDLLDVLVNKMESDSEIGAMQPKIKMMDDTSILDNAGAYLNPLGLTVHWGYGEKDSKEFNKEEKIFSAKGACLITRTDLVNSIGLFDDNFGSYFEESDFCFRVWLSGYKVIYYPKTFILHKVGFTSKKMDQVSVMLVSTRNRIFSLFKNLSTLHLFTVLGLHLLFLVILGLYYLVQLKFRRMWMIYGAIWWNISNISLLLSGRKGVQRLRVVSDDAIFPIIMKPFDLKAMFNHFKKVEANFKDI